MSLKPGQFELVSSTIGSFERPTKSTASEEWEGHKMQPESQNQDGFDLDLSSEFVEPMLKNHQTDLYYSL